MNSNPAVPTKGLRLGGGLVVAVPLKGLIYHVATPQQVSKTSGYLSRFPRKATRAKQKTSSQHFTNPCGPSNAAELTVRSGPMRPVVPKEAAMGRPVSLLIVTRVTLLVLVTACSETPVQPPSQTPSSPSALAVAPVPIATVSRIDLGTLGGTNSYATDVNNLGTVVGWSVNAAGVDRAFRWTLAQGMTDLGTLPGDDWSRAISITNTGAILGVSGRTGGRGTPLVWGPSGAPRPLEIPPPPGAAFVSPAQRNALGLVTGYAGGGILPHAFVWSPAFGTHDLTADFVNTYGESYGTDINAWGLVLGTNHSAACHTPECWHAFLWHSVTGYRDIGIPPGYDLSKGVVTGIALNDLGVVVGWTNNNGATGRTDPYSWTDRTGFTVLPTFSPDGYGGYAQSVNLLGTAVGGSWDSQVGAFQAAAWPRAGGIVRLSPDDPNPSVALAVNLSGVVVGWSSADCCGLVGNHATLWRLGAGRGMSPSTLTGQASPPVVTTASAASGAIPSGPIGCLWDPHAVVSRQHLIECVVKRGAGDHEPTN